MVRRGRSHPFLFLVDAGMGVRRASRHHVQEAEHLTSGRPRTLARRVAYHLSVVGSVGNMTGQGIKPARAMLHFQRTLWLRSWVLSWLVPVRREACDSRCSAGFRALGLGRSMMFRRCA
jgi:hypothetical protein